MFKNTLKSMMLVVICSPLINILAMEASIARENFMSDQSSGKSESTLPRQQELIRDHEQNILHDSREHSDHFGNQRHLSRSSSYDVIPDVEPLSDSDDDVNNDSAPSFAQPVGQDPSLAARSTDSMDAHDGLDRDQNIDVSALTPEQIQALDIDIAEWSPAQISQLSPEQTKVLNGGTLAFLNRLQLLALPIKDLNPQAVADIFTFESRIGTLPDRFVDELTPQQASEILKKANANLSSYFNDQQIELIRQKARNQVADNQPLSNRASSTISTQSADQNDNTVIGIPLDEPQNQPMPLNKPSWWRKLSSTLSNIVDGLVQQFAPRASISVARNAMRSWAHGANITNDPMVDKAFRSLTTKQKDSVANYWLKETKSLYAEKNRALEQDIAHLAAVNSMPAEMREQYIRAIQEKIEYNNRAMNDDINNFVREMSRYLHEDEQLISIRNASGMVRLECIDMPEIDPTKSIAAQKQQLKEDGIINTYDANWWDGSSSSITAPTLENLYTRWVSNRIIANVDVYQPLAAQIEFQVLKITKHEWYQLDQSFQEKILERINNYIKDMIHQARLGQERTMLEQDRAVLEKNIAVEHSRGRTSYTPSVNESYIGAINQKVKTDGLKNIAPEDIPLIDIDATSYITPQDFAQATDAQIHAFTQGQIRKMTVPDLLAMIPRMTQRQLSLIRPETVQTMSQEEFTSLINQSPQQTQEILYQMRAEAV